MKKRTIKIKFILFSFWFVACLPPRSSADGLLGSSSSFSGRQQLSGHVPELAKSSPTVGSLSGSQTLDLSIMLSGRNPEGLRNLIHDLYDLHHPNYRHFLTANQFKAQYGPVDSDYQKVAKFAADHNLLVKKTYTNNLVLDVTGRVEDIEKAFHVHLNQYQRPDGTLFHAPDQEPSIDLDVPLAHVEGLENAVPPKPAMPMTAKPIQPQPQAGTGYYEYYFGKDFRNTYLPCLSSSVNGSGQNVAIIEFATYYSSDIAKYAGDAGITEPTITNVSVGGYNTTDMANSNYEAPLDIEMVMDMAWGANIYVYEGSSITGVLNQIASDDTCEEITASYMLGGSSAWAYIFAEFAAQGQAFFQAAGDYGAYVAGGIETTVPGPMNYTSDLTAVGGTSLTTTGTGGTTVGTYSSETTWNITTPKPTGTPPSGYGGSGGICNASTPLPIPTYQVPFINAQNAGSSLYRNVPDVSMVAWNIVVYYGNGSKVGTGGTSAATPLWAGLCALVNQQLASAGQAPTGLLNQYLYTLANNPAEYTNDFHDINDGSTNNPGHYNDNLYKAVTGYDLATGLGSPKCNIVSDLVSVVEGVTLTPTFTYTATHTVTNTATHTNSMTPTNTETNTATHAATNTSTDTMTNTTTNTPTRTITNTPTNSASFSPTNTPTNTTSNTPSNTSTLTSHATFTYTSTSTHSDTNTETPTNTATHTQTSTATNTSTQTSTNTPTHSASATSTNTATNSVSNTPSNTSTNTSNATVTSTSTSGNTHTKTPTNTVTETQTTTVTYSQTNTVTLTTTQTTTPTSPIPSTFTSTQTSTTTSTATTTVIKTSTVSYTSTTTNTVTQTETPLLTPTPAPVKVTGIPVVYPNPSNGSPIHLSIPLASPTNVTVKIFTLAFRRVQQISYANLTPGTDLSLSLMDDRGYKLANGVYFVVVEAGQTRTICKLLIIQ